MSSSSRSRLSRRLTVVENRQDGSQKKIDKYNNTDTTTDSGVAVKQSWEEMYLELETYVKEHDNCIPNTRETKLGRWVSTQRARYHRDELDDSQIRDLNAIGFEWRLKEWEVPFAESWEEMYQNLLTYKEEHGNCNVPSLTTKLGRWVSTQRQRKKGNLQGTEPLTDDQIMRLENIGFQWRQKPNSGFKWWDEMYEELEEYYNTHGNCLVRESSSTTNGKLGSWVSRQRLRRRNGELPESQIILLDEINFEWESGTINHTWEDNFRLLQQFHELNGHSDVPTSGSFLGGWVARQRMNRRTQRTNWKPLTDDQIRRLDSLGFTWNAQDYDARWDEMYMELADYYSEHGHTRVPGLSGGKLGTWVQKQRQCKHKKSGSNRQLTQDQINRLDEIEFVWRADENIETWEAMYEKLRLYKEANGNCLVPQSQGKLGNWVESQRLRRKKQLGNQKKLTKDQIQMLDDLGFAWSAEERFQELWEQKFLQLKAYAEEHGHCQVPRRPNDRDKSVFALSRWVERMRGIHKGTLKGKTPLTEDQIERLDSIGCFQEISKKRRRKS